MSYKNLISYNNTNISLVGALTSKPYAFMARSWELKIFESIDIFDNLGSNIRVDLRNFEILRILPKFNYFLNEDWITDKVRFCYDGLRKQRLNQPLLNNDSNNLVPVSWEYSFNLFKKVLTTKSYHIDSFCGDLVDSESLLMFKLFLNKLGLPNFYYKNFKHYPTNYLNSRSNYIFNLNNDTLSNLNNLIFLNINLRLENPILNLKVRKNVLKNSLKIYNLGFFSNLTYSTINLGNNIFSLVKFVEGQSTICQNFIKKNTHCVIGSNIFYREDSKFFLENILRLKYILKEYFNFSIFNAGSNTLASAELGLDNLYINDKLHDNKNKILFLLDMDDILFDFSKYDFICYQGHHGDLNVYNANLIFPGLLPYEKKSTFLNLYGMVQSTDDIIKPLNLSEAKNDWKILKGLSDFLNINLNYESHSDIQTSLSRLFNFSTIDEGFSLKINKQYPFLSKGFNHNVSNYAGNYYLNNSITRASLVMALCAFRFKFKNF